MTNNNFVQNILEKRIVQHVVFWIAIVIYSTFFFGYPKQLLVWAKLSLIILPIDMAFVYITIYYLLPNYLLKKRILLFGILFLLLGYFDEIILRAITFEFFYNNRAYTYKDVLIGEGAFNIFTNYYIALVAVALRLFRIWKKENEVSKKNMQAKFDAEIKLKEVEHNLLKSQLHPHFLFNTLNNLYSLTLEKSDNAPEIVLKMSSMLSYMLYECNAPLVPLKTEVKQVLNYITLEQLRYDEDLTIKIENNCSNSSLNIAPLIILPFIENSFKHGASKDVGKSWINIIFTCDRRSFYLSISNNISEPMSLDDKENEGIGLYNVRQRLKTIYPDNHKLDIQSSNNQFTVSLNINL